MENWNVKLYEVPGRIGRQLFIFRTGPKGETIMHYGDSVEKGFGIGEVPEPTLYLSDEMLQELADVLSIKGFKPQKGFLEGKVEAIEKHLEDMRTIVFKK